MKTLNALFNHMDTCSERERDIVCWSLIAIAYGGTFIGFIVGR